MSNTITFQIPGGTPVFNQYIPSDAVLGASTMVDSNRLVSALATGSVKESLIADSVSAGVLTIAKTGITARTITYQDAAYTVPGLEVANTFTIAQLINFSGLTPAAIISSTTALTGVGFRIIGTPGSGSTMATNSFGTGGQFAVMRADGTAAVPTAVQSGEVLGRFQAIGFGATDYFNCAQMRFKAAENFTDTAVGTNLELLTVPIGSTTLATRLTIFNNGDLTMGGTVAVWSTNNGAAPTANTFPGHKIFGCNNATAATAGTIGESLISTISTYTNFTTTATYQALTSLSITSGEWDVFATVTFFGNAATLTAATSGIFLVGSTSASAAGTTEGLNIGYVADTLNASDKETRSFVFPLSLTTTTTYYLNGQMTFTGGNPQFVCTLRAVRRR